jgi:hypothetical protein
MAYDTRAVAECDREGHLEPNREGRCKRCRAQIGPDKALEEWRASQQRRSGDE